MLYQMMFVLAAMGTASQPAEVQKQQKAPIIRVAQAEPEAQNPETMKDNRKDTARRARTQPAGRRTPRIRVSTATRPADMEKEVIEKRITREEVEALQKELGQTFADIGKLSGAPLEIRATEEGNLVMYGNEKDLEILRALIEVMDRRVAPVSFKIFELENAQATQLAPQVEQLWNAAKQTARGRVSPEDRITIIPEPRSNKLMVATTEKNLEQIGNIIKQLDQPTLTDKMQFEPLPVEHIPATEAAEKLTSMLEMKRQRRGEEAKLVDVYADPRLNQVMVSASPSDIEQVKKWLEMIDVPPSPETGGVVNAKFFFLEKADATQLVEILEEMIQPATEAAEAAREQIRQLRIVNGEDSLPDLNLEKPIKLYADEGANAVVVATVPENMKPIEEIVNLLDTLPIAEEMVVRFFHMSHADAEQVMQTVNEMFQAGQQLPALLGREGDVPDRQPKGYPGQALTRNIALSVDRRTNTLLAAGQIDQILLVQQVVESVDQEGFTGKYSPRLIKLQHADVRRIEEIASELTEQWAQVAERSGAIAADKENTYIAGDVRSNSLIVAASKENFEEIKSLIEKLDQVGEDYLGDIHIINLDNLAAADIADKIEDLWERRSQLRADEGLPEDRPVIVTDARSNSLIIASNKEDFEAIKRVVSKLEAQKLSPMADIRIVKLEHNSASQVAETVETLFEERLEMSLSQDQEEPPSERIAIVDEPMTNSLLIASNKSNFEQVMDLVKKLDVLPDVEGVVRVFPIRHADVTKAAELIENMFEQNIYRGTAGDQDLPESEQEIAVVTDVRSSSLIISASPQNFAIVETLVNQIDQEDAPVFQAAARFFKLAHADVVSVASIMERLFEGMAAAAEEDDQYEITVIPDSRSNVLIVSGSRFAMRRAEELVQKLDREPGAPTSDMRVYMLDQASAATLEDIITEVFEERDEEQQDRTPVTVLADEGSNSLIVSASKEDHQVVTDLIAKLDKKSTLAQRMEVIKLQDAKAEQIADTLEDLIEQQQETEGTEVSFAITPEPRTNSLLVWAPPGMMTEIRTIVNTLDNTKSKAVMGLQVVKLYNSKAENMAELLDEFFEEAREGDEAEARQMIIKMIKGYDAQSHKPLFDKLVYQDVTIAADPNTNSLILMAPENNIDMMRTLVEMLDSVEPVVADIRPMPLYNANAEEMKDLLDELFQTERQGRGGEGEGRQQLVYGAGAAQALAAEGGAAIDLRFSVDMRTNTLIAAGSESYLDIVEEMVYKLDEREIEDRIQDVYRLQNAKATEVAQTMSDFFEQESELYETATEGEEAASRQLEREVSVHALEQEEGESSLLLLSYSPRMKSRIESMIAELDQPPPQVMIQVLMAEVTLDNNFEMGMEFALQDLLFSENAVVGPNDTLQGGDADFIAGTDVGAAGSGGLGGFSFSVTGEDFNFLLRALQSEGRLEVLSRPSIMVRDGDEADIQVGSEIPVVNDIAISGTGTVTPSVTYEEVGIGLNVTPIINPDGYVNMQINPEIDSVGESSVSIASGVSLPTFNNRTVETSVTVRDGETIIIGGLIKSTENDSENKVPLLGDIPILGNLFRAVNKEKSQTELLIVLTPKVIRTSADAREVSIEMRDQTGMMDETRHNPLMQGLQVKPHDDEFGPDQSELPIDTDIEDLDQPSADEQMGPAIEAQEFGPDVSTMNIHKGKRLAVQRAVAGRTSR